MLCEPFCAAVGRGDLARDPRFASRAGRAKHRAALMNILAPVFRERTVADWMSAFEACDVLAPRSTATPSSSATPRSARAGSSWRKSIRELGTFARSTQRSASKRRRAPGAPALGEHTDVVLREAGLSPDELTRLRAAGVVR
jgi:crotonobetainyl-CoA:carnitine CoA-transferase CaiB-like acyl-CoA transferase